MKDKTLKTTYGFTKLETNQCIVTTVKLEGDKVISIHTSDPMPAHFALGEMRKYIGEQYIAEVSK